MKEHYKLYKAGKLWLTACVATLGIFAASTNVHADDQQTATAQTVVAAQSSNSTQTNSTVITDNDSNSNMPVLQF